MRNIVYASLGVDAGCCHVSLNCGTLAITTAKLLDYTGRTDELLASDNPFALITLTHLRTQQAGHDADKLYAAKWQLTKRLFHYMQPATKLTRCWSMTLKAAKFWKQK